MKFFIDYSAKVTEETQIFRVMPSYLEVETHIKTPQVGIKTFFYISKVSQTSAFLMGCWGHELDAWMSHLEDKSAGKHWWNVFKKTYPTLAFLIGEPNGRFQPFTVTNMKDPDDGEQKWVIGLIVNNLKMSFRSEADYEKLVSSKNIKEAYTPLASLSVTGLKELRTNRISSFNKLKVQGLSFIDAHPEEIDLAKMALDAFLDAIKASAKP